MVVNDVIYFINGIFAAGCSIESLCPDEVFFMSMTIYELGFVSVTRGQLCFACIYFWVLSSLAIPMTDKMGWSICKDPYFELSVIYQFITFNQRLLLKKTNTFLKRILSFFVEIGLQIQSKLSNLSLNPAAAWRPSTANIDPAKAARLVRGDESIWPHAREVLQMTVMWISSPTYLRRTKFAVPFQSLPT